MFKILKKSLSTSIDNTSNHTKCVSLSNQKCTTQPTVINLHPNEYTQGLRYYPFATNVDKCVWSFNTINDLSKKIFFPNKIEHSNISIFNMIVWIDESKTVTKDIPRECKCKKM